MPKGLLGSLHPYWLSVECKSRYCSLRHAESQGTQSLVIGREGREVGREREGREGGKARRSWLIPERMQGYSADLGAPSRQAPACQARPSHRLPYQATRQCSDELPLIIHNLLSTNRSFSDYKPLTSSDWLSAAMYSTRHFYRLSLQQTPS